MHCTPAPKPHHYVSFGFPCHFRSWTLCNNLWDNEFKTKSSDFLGLSLGDATRRWPKMCKYNNNRMLENTEKSCFITAKPEPWPQPHLDLNRAGQLRHPRILLKSQQLVETGATGYKVRKLHFPACTVHDYWICKKKIKNAMFIQHLISSLKLLCL